MYNNETYYIQQKHYEALIMIWFWRAIHNVTFEAVTAKVHGNSLHDT